MTLPTEEPLALSTERLPAFFTSADAYAALWARRFTLLQASQLVLLLLAALGGATSWVFGDVEVSAWCSVAALTTALVLRLTQSQLDPEGKWYEGRAAAESTKTLAWRFAIAAHPFPADMDDAEARRLFATRLRGVAGILAHIDQPASGHQITDAMWAVRRSTLPERIDAYATGRIDDQLRWYGARAMANGRAAFRWGTLAAVVELGALIAAVLRLASHIEFDWLGILSTAAAGVVAWLQTRQHEMLARAYAVASHELLAIRDTIDEDDTEEGWASTANDAEAAISREHTMWLASRTGRT